MEVHGDCEWGLLRTPGTEEKGDIAKERGVDRLEPRSGHVRCRYRFVGLSSTRRDWNP